MTLTPEALRVLKAKGLTLDDAIEIAEALTPQRTSAAERQARYRQRKKAPLRNDGDVTGDVTRPPNERYSNPPASPSSANADDGPPPVEIRFVEAWNGEEGLRPARKLTGQRLTKFRKRLGEVGEPALFDAVRRLGASPFHCGKNDREWQADIGWLLKNDDNVTKALELPEAPKRAAPVDALAAAERTAAFYRKLGRDDDAAEAEQRAARLRERSSGPPRPIGELIKLPEPRVATS